MCRPPFKGLGLPKRLGGIEWVGVGLQVLVEGGRGQWLHGRDGSAVWVHLPARLTHRGKSSTSTFLHTGCSISNTPGAAYRSSGS